MNNRRLRHVVIASAGSAPVLPLPPINSVAPLITGTASVGATLTIANTGTWANSPSSYAYQWKRGGVAVTGETSSSYLLTGADAALNITCTVTASNAGGSGTATSNSIGPIASPTITTPVLTQTSTAGTAPFLFDATFNLADTFAGYTLRVQQAAGTGGVFTSPVQDISHTLDESEITSGSVDITSNGFLTWSGGGSLRARIERDDGVTSAWSNVLTDTISASVAKFASTAGVKHNTTFTLTNANLTVQGGVGAGAWLGQGTTIPGATKSQWELTLDAIGTEGQDQFAVGLYDETTDLTIPNNRPGVSDSHGFIIQSGIGSATFDWFYAATAQSGTLTAGSNNAVGDKITLEADTSGSAGTHSFSVYRTRAGVTTQIGASVTGKTLTGFTCAFVMLRSNVRVTANYGGSTFAHTLNSGFSMYG